MTRLAELARVVLGVTLSVTLGAAHRFAWQSPGQRVYIYPYAVGWSWAWTQSTGWVAVNSGRFELRPF